MFTPKMNYDELVTRFNELVATSYDYLKAIYLKRDEEMKEAVHAYKMAMANLGYTEEQMKDCLSTEGLPDGFSKQEVLALPEATQKVEEETAPVEEPVSTKPEEKEGEKILPPLQDLLSDDPEYKAHFAEKVPVKENNKRLPTLEQLLSGDPINRILNLGNEVPKGSPYRQNTRICHADGIIPTETASGQTIIYVPKGKPVVA